MNWRSSQIRLMKTSTHPSKKALKLIFTILIILLAVPALFPGSKPNRELHNSAFTEYSIGEYDTAYPLLMKLVMEDTLAFFWMDYFMLADIYLRRNQPDSSDWVINLGVERTEINEDPRLLKRNTEIWDNLKEQLNYQRAYLTIPPYRSLDHYAEKPPDSLTHIESKTASTDSITDIQSDSTTLDTALAIADTGETSSPVFVPGGGEFPYNPLAPALPPRLIGGMAAIQSYIEEHSLFPDSALQAGVKQGVVAVDVTVDTSGNAVDFIIIHIVPEGMGFEEMAVEVLKNMRFEPAVSDSVKVVGILQQMVPFQAP